MEVFLGRSQWVDNLKPGDTIEGKIVWVITNIYRKRDGYHFYGIFR